MHWPVAYQLSEGAVLAFYLTSIKLVDLSACSGVSIDVNGVKFFLAVSAVEGVDYSLLLVGVVEEGQILIFRGANS